MTATYDAAAATSQVDSQNDSSTVSKHVLLWTLLTIITNTMAQSAAIDNNNTVYYHSSPLYSLAHVIWIWIHAIAHFITCKDKTGSISQMLLFAKQSTNVFFKDENGKPSTVTIPASSKTWPRWLFFILGSLPATIKLCSFEGVQWSQAFGLMSFSAFVLTELFVVLVRWDSIVEPDLGPVAEQEPLNESLDTPNDVELKGLLVGLTALTYFVLGLLNAASITWVAMKVWVVLMEAFHNNDNDVTRLFQWAFLLISLAIDSTFLIYIVILGCIKLRQMLATNPDTVPSYIHFTRWFPYVIIAFFLTTLLPVKEDRKRRTATMNAFWDFDAVAYFSFSCFWIARGVMRIMVRKWPRLGETLFLVKMTSETKEDGDIVKELDDNKWFGFCFFWVHLWLAIVYYQLVYDDSETRSPQWNEVFGR